MINNLFWNFEFPLNLIAPISSAIFGLFVVNLIYKILEFVQPITYINLQMNFQSYSIYTLVFFVILIVGYFKIINEESKREKKYPKKHRRDIQDKREKNSSNIYWEDVRDEFRKVFFNVGKALNRTFESKKRKNKKIKNKFILV
jgi:hypothetical protein